MDTIFFGKKKVFVVGIGVVVLVVIGGVVFGVKHRDETHDSTVWKRGLVNDKPVVATSVSQEVPAASTPEPTPPFPTTDVGNLGRLFAQPSLHDGLLVWLSTTKGIQHNADTLHLMDLHTKKQRTLAASSYQQGNTYLLCPQVNQDWAAWIDTGDTNTGRTEFAIYAMNLHTQDRQKITAIPVGDSGIQHINLHGDELIWSEMTDHTHAAIKRYDLQTKKATTILQVETDVLPFVYRSGDDLVWEVEKPKVRITSMDVYDLKQGHLKFTMSIDGRYAYPKINADQILYSPQQGESMRTQLALYDMTSQKTTTFPALDHSYWDIGNRFITWVSNEGLSSNIYVKRIGNDSPPILLGEGYLPFANDDTIVWQSADYQHVYVSEIK